MKIANTSSSSTHGALTPRAPGQEIPVSSWRGLLSRRPWLAGVSGVILLPILIGCQQTKPVRAAGPAQPEASVQTEGSSRSAGTPPSMLAAARLNELGPENGNLAQLAGLWDVTETVWATPNAAPAVTKNLVAERKMVGSMLQETLRSLSDPSGKILRMDYLSFNRVEGRWEYVSIETRAAVGIMTAQSYGRGKDDHIDITFQPFSVAGPGQEPTGQMLRMRQEINTEAPGRNQKDQYFIMADGNSTEWLAHRYAYVRRS